MPLAARGGNARVTASRITLRPRERKGTHIPYLNGIPKDGVLKLFLRVLFSRSGSGANE